MPMAPRFKFSGAVLALLLPVLGAPAHAHITLETRQAEAGSSYRAVLRVGHGCDGSPVRELTVDLPPGVQGAKPMVKPGWQIDIERQPLPAPRSSHGKTITEDVSRIRFRGGLLPDAHYDEFVIVARLPEEAGPLYWKVSQVCEQGRIDWVEAPAASQALRDLKAPAALLEVTPKAAATPAPAPAPADHKH